MSAYVTLSAKNDKDTWSANTSLTTGDGYVYVTDAGGQVVATTESEMSKITGGVALPGLF